MITTAFTEAPSIRVGIINQPNEKLTFKVLFGTAFRAPTNFELYTAGGSRIANPYLKPERIQTYEANIIYIPAKILLVQVNLFQNQLTDIIVQDVAVGGGQNQNQNVGTASVQGLKPGSTSFLQNYFQHF